MHANGMRLEHGCFVVDIDDQSGKPVSLTMAEPVNIRTGVRHKAQLLSQAVSGSDLFVPEAAVDCTLFKTYNPYRYTAMMEMPGAQVPPVGRKHLHNASFPAAFILALDGTGKNPWMKIEQRPFLAFLQNY